MDSEVKRVATPLGDLLFTGRLASNAPSSWWSKEQIAEAMRRYAVDGEPPAVTDWLEPPREAGRWVRQAVREGRVIDGEEVRRRRVGFLHVSEYSDSGRNREDRGKAAERSTHVCRPPWSLSDTTVAQSPVAVSRAQSMSSVGRSDW